MLFLLGKQIWQIQATCCRAGLLH
ncbi:hypothetical protein NC652_009434 [Populus alba x Populus x berolinensis]|nr:hypothetical protein NC652_009434 [Populus alba x Populus x berolinensis]